VPAIQYLSQFRNNSNTRGKNVWDIKHIVHFPLRNFFKHFHRNKHLARDGTDGQINIWASCMVRCYLLIVIRTGVCQRRLGKRVQRILNVTERRIGCCELAQFLQIGCCELAQFLQIECCELAQFLQIEYCELAQFLQNECCELAQFLQTECCELAQFLQLGVVNWRSSYKSSVVNWRSSYKLGAVNWRSSYKFSLRTAKKRKKM
jgi:hypothetical protein